MRSIILATNCIRDQFARDQLFARNSPDIGHYNGCVKFECNDGYYCIRKTILNGDDLILCTKADCF